MFIRQVFWFEFTDFQPDFLLATEFSLKTQEKCITLTKDTKARKNQPQTVMKNAVQLHNTNLPEKNFSFNNPDLPRSFGEKKVRICIWGRKGL